MMKSKSRKSKPATKPKPRAPPPSGPTLIPPTAGSCATCFYGQTKIDIGGSELVRVCRVDRPTRVSDASHHAAWPVVADTDWCGDGEDMTTYGPFAPTWY